MIYGDFLSIPLILVITLQNRKTLFYVFLRFRNLPELKLTWDFLGVNILSQEPYGAQELNEGGLGGQTRPGGAGQGPGHATQVCLGLEPLILSIFVSWRSAWPKNTHINTPPPSAFTRGGGGETRNTEIEVVLAKIGRGNATGVAPGCFSNLSNINTIDTTLKREYSTSRLWVCGSSLFYLSLSLTLMF
jgi:hypothetical protein